MKLHRHLFAFACPLLLCLSAANAADWTHWRGPEQMGISRELGLIEDWSLETKENVLWTSKIGGRSTPIVMNGRVFFNCRTLDNVNDPKEKIHAQEQVVCLDAATGDTIWTDPFNVFQTDIPAPRVGWASMAGDSETGYVYMHSVSGLFRCYDSDSKVIWEYSLFEEYGKIAGYGGRTQSPIIDEDRVIVSFMMMNWGDTKSPPPKQTYYAFDKKTGKLLWTSAPGGAPLDTNYSVPIVTVIGGVRMLIGGNSDGGCYAINARTGEPLWGFRMSRRGLNCSPVVEDGRIYISHGEDNIDNLEFGRVQCIDATGRGDITKTGSVWRVDGIKAGFTSNLVKDGILYVVTDTGLLLAYDSKTGTKLWDFKIGTVGKGSPVWADGKLYVMEVNGNIHILKPSRKKCVGLSHVELASTGDPGPDEIYASPAIVDGRIFLVTRDRTICLGKKGHKPKSDPIPPMADEKPMVNQIAHIKLIPAETRVSAGESIVYELRAYDANGRFIKTLEPKIEPQATLPGAKVQGSTLVTANTGKDQGGTVVAKLGDLTATARVRVYPPLGWKWDFEGYKGKQVPPSWVRAFLKLQPVEIDGNTVMKNSGGKGRPSTYIWIGTPDMKGYTVQADVMGKYQRRRMPNIGITAHRYNLVLKGNASKLEIVSWAAHKRMGKDMKFRWDPDVWYTMKLRVDVEDGKAHVKGKVWKRGDAEPEKWTIETTDPHANLNGSPGIYFYALAESYIDNVTVTGGK